MPNENALFLHIQRGHQHRKGKQPDAENVKGRSKQSLTQRHALNFNRSSLGILFKTTVRFQTQFLGFAEKKNQHGRKEQDPGCNAQPNP